jgi:hypothetical protein
MINLERMRPHPFGYRQTVGSIQTDEFRFSNGAPPGHRYKLLVGLVALRPIALISSKDENAQLNAGPV